MSEYKQAVFISYALGGNRESITEIDMWIIDPHGSYGLHLILDLGAQTDS